MNSEERDIISGIFQRLQQAQSQQRDADAERFIAEKIRAQPYAPYAMAQLIYVQEEAIKSLNQQLEEAKRQAASSQSAGGGGGFLSSIFGGGGSQRPPEPQQRPGGAWGGQQPGYAHPSRAIRSRAAIRPSKVVIRSRAAPGPVVSRLRLVAAASSPPPFRWRRARQAACCSAVPSRTLSRAAIPRWEALHRQGSAAAVKPS